MADAVYRGQHDPRTGQYRVTVQHGTELPIVLTQVVLHSPTGFAWGYGGSGPADLALAILADHLGQVSACVTALQRKGVALPEETPTALRAHQAFKWDTVAKFGSRWELTGLEVALWLEAQRPGAVDKR